MGANDFQVVATGKDAETAFFKAVDAAAYEHGHGGYTGTIAEKCEFKRAEFTGTTPQELRSFIDEQSETEFEDKWGPAGCVELRGNLLAHAQKQLGISAPVFVFFGWASS